MKAKVLFAAAAIGALGCCGVAARAQVAERHATLGDAREWATIGVAWHVPEETGRGFGSLWIEVDRSLLTGDVVLALDFFDHPNAALYVDLCNSDGGDIATDLFGNLMQGSAARTRVWMGIPFATYGEAVGLRLRRGWGEVTVYESVLHVNLGVTNLAAGQENQPGLVQARPASDASGLAEEGEGAGRGAPRVDPDSDGDGLSNHAEIGTHRTNPSLADSDGDGASDGYEVNTLGTNPLAADQGSDPGGPVVTILYPKDGALILW